MVARFESEAGKLEASAVLGRESNGRAAWRCLAGSWCGDSIAVVAGSGSGPLRLFSAHRRVSGKKGLDVMLKYWIRVRFCSGKQHHTEPPFKDIFRQA
jgi:hypothetical protein